MSFQAVRLTVAASLLSLTSVSSQTPRDAVVLLDSSVAAAPPSITLRWKNANVGNGYRVYRRTSTGASWGEPIAQLGSGVRKFTDPAVRKGRAYEYRVERITEGYTSNGYLSAGIELPVRHQRGTLILLVEKQAAQALVPEITRLEEDLVGDGWVVVRRNVSATTRPVEVKAIIQRLAASTSRVNALFLLGRIAVPYAGDIAPDGHSEHRGAWPADSFYGELSGQWTDNHVNNREAVSSRTHNVPGDGKFDQSHLPDSVRLMVGRVDMANLPGFNATEIELLRRYLEKDHAFRHAKWTIEERALIDDEFGWHIAGAAYAASGWRLGPVVGRDNVAVGSFLPTVQNDTYLWAYGCGPGSYSSVGGVASIQDFETAPVRAVFCMLLGSYMGDWDSGADQPAVLRGALAAKGHSLAAMWAGQPHWHVHHMALGEPVGFAARVTQNNSGGEYRGPGGDGWGRTERAVHVALMGDPTLRLHPMPPASVLVATRGADAMQLTWSASPAPDVAGYHVYRGTNRLGPFQRLTPKSLTETSFTDAAPTEGAIYQVRAMVLQHSPSGSYFNQSQGIFVTSPAN